MFRLRTKMQNRGPERFYPNLTSACAGYFNGNQKWINNEAHGGLFGVYLNKDGLPGCSLIQDFFIWRSFDYGIYFQVSVLKFLSP